MLVSMSLFKLNPQFKAECGLGSSDDITLLLEKVFLKGNIQEELYSFSLFVIQFYQRRINTPIFLTTDSVILQIAVSPAPPPSDLLTLLMYLFATPGWTLPSPFIISPGVWRYTRK